MKEELEGYLEFLEYKCPEVAADIKERSKAFPHRGDKYLRLAKAAFSKLGGKFNFSPFSAQKQLPTEGLALGHVLDGDTLSALLLVTLKALAPLFGLFGASRTGKTMALIYGILVRLIEMANGIGGTIFDPEGQYKLHLYPKYPDKVMVFKPNEFKLNPLIPPAALTKDEWKHKFASLWRSLYCGDAMINMLVNALDFVYANHSTPTFRHLKERIQSLSFKPTERAFQHKESLLSRINWLESMFGEAWNCAEGVRRSDIMGKWIVFETTGLDLALANFFQDLIIERKKYSQETFSDEPREVLVFEEAHYRFGAGYMLKNTELGERTALSELRTLGKYGFVTIILDQAPSLLAPQLIANLSGALCFRLNNSQCKRRISDFMGLTPEQEEAIPMLGHRQAVFFSHHSLPSPTLVQIQDFEISSITAEEIEPRIKEAISKLHYIPGEQSKPKEAEQSGTPGPTKIHLDVEKDFAENWFIGLDEREKKFGNVGHDFFLRVVKDLQDMGDLGPLEEFGEGRGRPKKTAFVTEKGAHLLGMDYSQCIPPGKGSGSAQHRYMQMRIKEAVNGITEFLGFDVVQFLPEGRSVAYEIELNPQDDHFLDNILSGCLKDMRMVVVVGKNPDELRKLKKKAEEKLSAQAMARTRFATFKEICDGTFRPE